MEEINQANGGGVYKVKSLTPKTFSVEVDTTKFGLYDSGGYAN
jgi:hypothetical protein